MNVLLFMNVLSSLLRVPNRRSAIVVTPRIFQPRPFQQSFVRYKSKRMSVDSTLNPLAGFWRPTHLAGMYYGAGSVDKYILKALPSDKSKAIIVTGNSLATKTDLIKQVEQRLGSQHVATFSQIKQHSPIVQLDEILSQIINDDDIDTVISIGGGSPIDSSKAISYRFNEKKGKYLFHITIPTTLSAAECTMGAGLTTEDGLKTTVGHPKLAPQVIIYDAVFGKETPQDLWMSTGFRAMDHAVESMYHPSVSGVTASTTLKSYRFARQSKY